MNNYYLLVKFNNGRGPEKWGPYPIREYAVSVKEQNEYRRGISDIELKTEPRDE